MVERKESLIDRMKKNKAAYQKGSLSSLNDMNKKNYKKDEQDPRFFTLKVGETGTGSAIIKFLPTGGLKFTSDETPMNIFKKHQHYFQGLNGWFVNNCPTMIGENCPVCENNREIWSFNEQLARSRGRGTEYICNVLVIKNPLEPEYEGKILLFKFGAELYKKLMERIPKSEDQIGKYTDSGDLLFDPFFLLDAVPNFKLKLKMEKATIAGKSRDKRNFQESSFLEEPFQLPEDKIEKVYASCVDLRELYTWDSYKLKSYNELMAEFKKVTTTKEENTEDEVKKIKKAIDEEKKKEPTTKESPKEEFDLDLDDLDKVDDKKKPTKKAENKILDEDAIEEESKEETAEASDLNLDELF